MTAKYPFLNKLGLTSNSYDSLLSDGLIPNISRPRFDLFKVLAAAGALNNPRSLTLNWQHCFDPFTKNYAWGNLWRIDLTGLHFNSMHGVYIIWYYTSNLIPITVRVGQGFIKDRFSVYRSDREFLELGKNHYLLATWASVSLADRDGVEKYLGDTLKPIIADRFPDATLIRVNLPW